MVARRRRCERTQWRHHARKHHMGAHLVAVPLEGVLADVHAVHGHNARRGVVEALQQLDDGALAAAGGADESDGLTRHRLRNTGTSGRAGYANDTLLISIAPCRYHTCHWCTAGTRLGMHSPLHAVSSAVAGRTVRLQSAPQT
jgi:hypothetical protein